MNKKELNEEEIRNYILSDPNNEIMNLYQDKKKLFNTHPKIARTRGVAVRPGGAY
jgi:hypothetical protein